jgi:hypothetical protein
MLSQIDIFALKKTFRFFFTLILRSLRTTNSNKCPYYTAFGQ